MRRFFVDLTAIVEGRVTILGQDAHHIANVLRLKIGDRIAVSNGVDKVYEIELSDIDKNQVIGVIKNVETVEPEMVRLTVFQGLPKGKKMDFIVEKLTEIGVERIVPVAMARSVAEYDGARGDKKLERWRAIAVEAAKQSKRVTVPEIGEIASFKAAVEALKAYDKVIVPWEEVAETAPRISTVIASINHVIPSESEESSRCPSGATRSLDKNTSRDDSFVFSIALVIGPEGGIDQAEVDALLGSNAVAVSLGKTILRTETAGLVASALILLGSGERRAGSSGS
jgi:16S rRNA (uracil1498-N3)-methyltransferase